MTPEQRFWLNVDKRGDDECWPWLASTRQGYGAFTTNGHSTSGHRFSYELLIGPIPPGLQIDHLCRNRACVNPKHLEPVTARENLLRGQGWTAINSQKDACLRGHLFSPENTYRNARGDRSCKRCRRVAWRKFYERNRDRLNAARRAERSKA